MHFCRRTTHTFPARWLQQHLLILGLQQKSFRGNTHRARCSAAHAARALGPREPTTTGKTQTGKPNTAWDKSFDSSFARCPFFNKAWKFLPPAHCSLINASRHGSGTVGPPAPRPPGAGCGLHHLPPAKGAAGGGEARPDRGHHSPPRPPMARRRCPDPPAESGPAAGQGGGHVCPPALTSSSSPPELGSG